jgi:hypothetical protein
MKKILGFGSEALAARQQPKLSYSSAALQDALLPHSAIAS